MTVRTTDAAPVPADPEARTIAPDVAGVVAATLKAVADPLRLRMLALVASSPGGHASAGDLAALADVSGPTASHHLKVLKDVGVLTARRRGTWVDYRVAPAFAPVVRSLLDTFVPAAGEAVAGPHELVGLTDVDRALTGVAERLAARHRDLPAGQVLATARESYAALARQASARAHLVALTARFAEQRLVDLGTAAAPPAGRVPQVLFVCTANAGRSQLAAALVAHHAGARVRVRSAGSAPAGHVHATVRPLLDELGAAAEAFPKPITDDAVRASDVVVTMGCGDVCPVLPGIRYEDWPVGDPAVASPAGVAAIRADLDRRVRALLAELLPDLGPLDAAPTGSDATGSAATGSAAPDSAPPDLVPTDQETSR